MLVDWKVVCVFKCCRFSCSQYCLYWCSLIVRYYHCYAMFNTACIARMVKLWHDCDVACIIYISTLIQPSIERIFAAIKLKQMHIINNAINMWHHINISSHHQFIVINNNIILGCQNEWMNSMTIEKYFHVFLNFFCCISKTHSTLLHQAKKYIIVTHLGRAITTACQIVPNININKDRGQITHVCTQTFVHTRCWIIP